VFHVSLGSITKRIYSVKQYIEAEIRECRSDILFLAEKINSKKSLLTRSQTSGTATSPVTNLVIKAEGNLVDQSFRLSLMKPLIKFRVEKCRYLEARISKLEAFGEILARATKGSVTTNSAGNLTGLDTRTGPRVEPSVDDILLILDTSFPRRSERLSTLVEKMDSQCSKRHQSFLRFALFLKGNILRCVRSSFVRIRECYRNPCGYGSLVRLFAELRLTSAREAWVRIVNDRRQSLHVLQFVRNLKEIGFQGNSYSLVSRLDKARSGYISFQDFAHSLTRP